MGAFSAYEFLNFVLPGGLLLAVGFNHYLRFLETRSSEAAALVLFAGLAFIAGQLNSAIASFLWDKLWDKRDAGIGAESKQRLDQIEVTLELLGRDAHSSMLSQQENLHRNLAMACLLALVATAVTIPTETNRLGLIVLPLLAIASVLFALRSAHFHDGRNQYLALVDDSLDLADKYSEIG